jgi:DNA-binding CsgD family transcriptional regulator
MTRGEIREAIKKVLFEEIEPDSLTKKMSFRSKTGSKKYKSLDKKQKFKSRHEALAYNIFDKEGVLDQIESEAYRFRKTCNKVPDFVWENKKIIIEIAGMNDSLAPNYWKKLLTAKPCLEKQGYTVYIIDTRTGSIYYNYIKFYKYLCKLLGFTPKAEIIDDIYPYVGDRIDLIKRNQDIIKYYKDNEEAIKNKKITYQQIADKFDTTIKTVSLILQQNGLTNPNPLTRDQIQARNQKIINFAEQNQEAIKNQEITYQEIADKLSTPDYKITINMVDKALNKANFTTSRSLTPDQIQDRNQEILDFAEQNREAIKNQKITRQQIADKFSTPNNKITYQIVNKVLRKADFFTPRSLTPDQIQSRYQKISQYKKDNPNATPNEIANKLGIKPNDVYNFYQRLKKSNPTNEQSTNNKTMTRNELREIIKKALKETTIDVPNPDKLTPQQKQQAITKARQTTRKPKLGTAEDPIDFI